MDNYLITGGAGFIGSHLIDKLLKNSNVVCVDNFCDYYDPAIKRSNIKKYLKEENFKLYETDITDVDGLKKIFDENDIDCIINMAARAGVRSSDTRAYTKTNIDGLVNLLECAKERGIKKFIQASSSSVYGESDEIPFSENARIDRPVSIYAATKAAGEKLCYTYSHLYGINIVCLRFFTVYGPRQRPDMAIHKFTKLISEENPVSLYGDGSTKRDYTYIDDIVQGIIASIDYDLTPYEIINLGSSSPVELRYLIEILEKNLDKKAVIKEMPLQIGDVTNTYANVSKAEKLLNYFPKTKIEEGVEKFVRWFLFDK